MNGGWWVLLPLGAAVCGACSLPAVRLSEGPREYVAEDYESVLQRWTRTVQLIVPDRFDNVLTATATYESWDFRWAYAVRYADDYRLTVEQRRRLLDRSLAETRSHHQFYLALYAKSWAWSDLAASEPAWIVRLVDDRGNETAPSAIEPVKKPGAIERTYFPYTTPWRRAYRVRFPKERAGGRPTVADDARWFGLRFAGAQGNDVLAWEVEGARRVAAR